MLSFDVIVLSDPVVLFDAVVLFDVFVLFDVAVLSDPAALFDVVVLFDAEVVVDWEEVLPVLAEAVTCGMQRSCPGWTTLGSARWLAEATAIQSTPKRAANWLRLSPA